MNGRNDLDACWLIAHVARIPFPLQAMLRSESLAHWIQRSFQTTLPAGGRGSIGSAVLGAVTKLRHRRMLATKGEKKTASTHRPSGVCTLAKLGFQVFILCADVCLHPLIPARSGFCLCQLSLLWFCLLCFTTGYCIHCQKAICVFRVHFRKTE